MNIKRVLISLFLLLWGGSAAAFPYFIDPFVNGAEMEGIEVSVFFDDNTNETTNWVATGADSGGAFGMNWKLVQSGDTLNQPNLDAAWTLSNDRNDGVSITGFKIDVWVAGIVFDVIMEKADPAYPLGYDEHTPGSRQGRPFTDDGSLPIANVTYLNSLSAPDLYGGLEVALGAVGASSGLGAGDSFQFMIDTDQVPESPLYALLALGFVGLFYTRRARQAA